MRLTIPNSSLAAAIGAVSRTVANRTTIPILGYLHCVADAAGFLTLTASDLDREATARVAASVPEPGTFALPARLIEALAGKVPDGATVSIEIEHERAAQAKIKAGRARYSLPLLPPEDFPNRLAVAPVAAFTMRAADLAALIAPVKHAASTEASRYYLNGIYLHLDTDEAGAQNLVAVATDGHRLSRAALPAPVSVGQMPSVIVPSATAAEILRQAEAAAQAAAKGGGGTASIEVGPNHLAVETEAVRLVSKLIDGTFPDYARIVPARRDDAAVLDIAETRAALARVAVVAPDKSGAIKCAFDAASLTVSARAIDGGDAAEPMPIEYEGAPLEIGFNRSYFDEALGALAGETARLHMASPGDAARIEPATVREGAPQQTIVIMPLRVV
jgi:DNA polymerase-3 subunit beta